MRACPRQPGVEAIQIPRPAGAGEAGAKPPRGNRPLFGSRGGAPGAVGTAPGALPAPWRVSAADRPHLQNSFVDLERKCGWAFGVQWSKIKLPPQRTLSPVPQGCYDDFFPYLILHMPQKERRRAGWRAVSPSFTAAPPPVRRCPAGPAGHRQSRASHLHSRPGGPAECLPRTPGGCGRWLHPPHLPHLDHKAHRPPHSRPPWRPSAPPGASPPGGWGASGKRTTPSSSRVTPFTSTKPRRPGASQ